MKNQLPHTTLPISGNPTRDSRAALKKLPTFVLAVAMAALVGCASTKVTTEGQMVREKLAKPGQILVHDFAVTASEVPAESALSREYSLVSGAQTGEQIALGRELSGLIASRLVEEIQKMGMPVTRVVAGSKAEVNDLVIRGYLVSAEEGSTAKRVTIGFGSGKSELLTAVEVFQATDQGLRSLGKGTVKAGGGKSPGMAVGAATWAATANPAGLIVSSGMKVYGEASGSSKLEGRAKATAKEIAQRLEERFKEQGWIK